MLYRENEGEYGKYIVQDLRDPGMGTLEFQQMYKKFANRILWIDDNVVEGAFQMNTSWYCRVPERYPVFDEHVHASAEIIGFFGSNPDDPYALGAELEVTLNGEKHLLTRTSLIFVPANMPHMPLGILRVERPIFHFSVVISPRYDGASYK